MPAPHQKKPFYPPTPKKTKKQKTKGAIDAASNAETSVMQAVQAAVVEAQAERLRAQHPRAFFCVRGW